MRYSLNSTLPYSTAGALILELENAGIEARITAGGIAIYIEADQHELMNSICSKYGVSPHAGMTDHQATVIQRHNYCQGCGRREDLCSCSNFNPIK